MTEDKWPEEDIKQLDVRSRDSAGEEKDKNIPKYCVESRFSSKV